jgi:hypothetical protein
MFQTQVTREKRGMGNMTNIFPPEVERMHIVTCDRNRQNDLATQITADLEARAHHLRTIEQKRAEIGNLIETAIELK